MWAGPTLFVLVLQFPFYLFIFLSSQKPDLQNSGSTWERGRMTLLWDRLEWRGSFGFLKSMEPDAWDTLERRRRTWGSRVEENHYSHEFSCFCVLHISGASL
ncbi:hypothetical protein BJ166DRAFT_292010 [Pestalotiopsis sp. NC0098]|nr:hypothetical protein BJ166DRAFT_292010 [Pestalotiopsis sp. NC0098]